MNYALDSNIVSYLLKGNSKLANKIDRERRANNIVIPPIVYYEINKWLMKNNSKEKIRLFNNLCSNGIGNIDRDLLDMSCSIYLKLQEKGKPVGNDNDIIIAAFCIKHNLILVTNNIKHFENIENLTVENWL
jgi:predicted nucleic acid-binding protein